MWRERGRLRWLARRILDKRDGPCRALGGSGFILELGELCDHGMMGKWIGRIDEHSDHQLKDWAMAVIWRYIYSSYQDTTETLTFEMRLKRERVSVIRRSPSLTIGQIGVASSID